MNLTPTMPSKSLNESSHPPTRTTKLHSVDGKSRNFPRRRNGSKFLNKSAASLTSLKVDFRKTACFKALMRIVYFSLHFLIVMAVLFGGAIMLAYLEDPDCTDTGGTTDEVNTPANASKAELGVQAANATQFWLQLHNRHNISVNESDRDIILNHFEDYIAALKEKEEQEQLAKDRKDRLLIFRKWFYFANIATTTVGYGDISPKTKWGRIFYILFSIVGVPLMMTLLVSCGDIMTEVNKRIFRLIQKCIFKGRKPVSEELLSALTILLMFAGYVAAGCLFTYHTERWEIHDSIYFWIVTFTTVGFGDMTQSLEYSLGPFMAPLVVYRTFGLALLAGVVDSLVAYVKVRKEYLRQKRLQKPQLPCSTCCCFKARKPKMDTSDSELMECRPTVEEDYTTIGTFLAS